VEPEEVLMRILILAFTVAGIALLMVSLTTVTHAGGGGCHEPQVMTGDGPDVDMSRNCFSPAVVRVQPGEAVTWTNRDGYTHMVTGVARSWGDSTELGQSGAVTHRFSEGGVFPYYCALHPGMVGAVVVEGGASEPLQLAVEEAQNGGKGSVPWLLIGAVAAAITAVGTTGMILSRR
jgi:plastocyanin